MIRICVANPQTELTRVAKANYQVHIPAEQV